MMSAASEPIDSGSDPSTLSKSQLKKLKKREKWLAARGERRKVEKEKRKAKRKAQAEERAKLGLDHVRPKLKPMSESNNKFRVVIDMDFEDYMTEAELAKSVQQVGRIYSLNRHAENPCQLHLTSIKGKILDKFSSTNTGYTNWDCNVSDLSYIDLFKSNEGCPEAAEDSSKKQIIYLTGDTDVDLPDVDDILKDESKIFIIGGLVDHNRHKMLCYRRASERQIATARLPISKYVTLSQRSILSTVTVFEILLKVLGSHKSWSEAFLEAIPKRKIANPVDTSIVDGPTSKVEIEEE